MSIGSRFGSSTVKTFRNNDPSPYLCRLHYWMPIVNMKTSVFVVCGLFIILCYNRSCQGWASPSCRGEWVARVKDERVIPYIVIKERIMYSLNKEIFKNHPPPSVWILLYLSVYSSLVFSGNFVTFAFKHNKTEAPFGKIMCTARTWHLCNWTLCREAYYCIKYLARSSLTKQ